MLPAGDPHENAPSRTGRGVICQTLVFDALGLAQAETDRTHCRRTGGLGDICGIVFRLELETDLIGRLC